MIAHETMQQLKDWGQLAGYFIAVPVALVGLGKAVYEISANRKQRASELRWKQAQAAKELLDDIHNHERTKQAVHMMDWVDGSAEYRIRPDLGVVISYSEVLQALSRNNGEKCDEKETFIRDCFDWFFYRVDRIEHYIQRELIQFDDVKGVFRFYARQVRSHQDLFRSFLGVHEYELARKFFERYSDAEIAAASAMKKGGPQSRPPAEQPK